MAQAPRRALVVEDDDDIRDVVTMLLTVLGFDVRDAGNGQDALEVLRAGWIPTLIVLDLMMPVMNGWAFRAEQRKIPGAANVPVIVLSARRPRPNQARQTPSNHLPRQRILPQPVSSRRRCIRRSSGSRRSQAWRSRGCT